MDHVEAAKIYDASNDSMRRYYGVLGILFFHYQLPKLIQTLRGLINEKSN